MPKIDYVVSERPLILFTRYYYRRTCAWLSGCSALMPSACAIKRILHTTPKVDRINTTTPYMHVDRDYCIYFYKAIINKQKLLQL